MAELDVEVLKRSLGQADGPGSIALGAVARLQRIDGKMRDSFRSVALGVGTAPQRITDLDAGEYEVRLMLPSGKVMTQQVMVPSAGIGHISFDIDIAPSAILAWQQFGGQIANPARAFAPSFDSGHSNILTTGLSIDVPPELFRDIAGHRGFESSKSLGPVDPVGDIDLLTIEVQPSNDDVTIDPARILEVWDLLEKGVLNQVKPVEMVKGFFKRLPQPVDADELHNSWQFELMSENVPGKRPARCYAVTRGRDLNELVCLPLPWRIDLQEQHWGGERIVDLLVDKSPAKKGVRSSVVVRDSNYGGLIAYMGTGAIGLAGEMMRASRELENVALDMLGEKSKSPLGACAAAYVLLATREWAEQSESEPRWVQWIRNLGNDQLYNWIPDASILCARMILQQAETEQQASEAVPHLHRALRNGLPFYALGYRWLLEAMRFCLKDQVIGDVFDQVDKVSRYVDTTQTFVALQLDVPK